MPVAPRKGRRWWSVSCCVHFMGRLLLDFMVHSVYDNDNGVGVSGLTNDDNVIVIEFGVVT